MNDPEFDDPIIDEIRRIRAVLAEECGGDLDRIVRRAMTDEAAHPERMAKVPLRRPYSHPSAPAPDVREIPLEYRKTTEAGE